MAIGFFLDEQCAISVRSDKYQIYLKCLCFDKCLIPIKADSESSLVDLLDLPDLEEFLFLKNFIWKQE